jgi:hypothetical protein
VLIKQKENPQTGYIYIINDLDPEHTKNSQNLKYSNSSITHTHTKIIKSKGSKVCFTIENMQIKLQSRIRPQQH